MDQVPEKKKRGRKAKIHPPPTPEEMAIEKIPKKRGRKPKGGKVITVLPSTQPILDSKINIILHLKCNTNDIKDDIENTTKGNIDNFQFSDNKSTDLNFMIYNTKQEVIQDLENNNKSQINYKITTENSDNCENISNNDNMKVIWQKLEKLSTNLHLNNICDKKSACFHCTCDFDNVPINIPKYELNQVYYVYGCFCSPECACAHLMDDKNIDTTTRFERYQLLNFIYCKIYDYNKNIKPAPSPYYMLDKFYGNLSIQEYRKLLKNERLLLIVEKPLIRILPELHEDSEDYLLNYQGIPPSTTTKFNLQKHNKQQSKNDILHEQFNVR